MSLQNYYTVDLFVKFPTVLKKCFILNCSDDIIKFFCDSIFNVVKGNVKLAKALQNKLSTLSREKKTMENLCSKRKVSVRRKRYILASTRGLRLLKLILPSVSNHLKICHGVERQR